MDKAKDRSTRIEVNLDAIAQNVEELKRRAPDAELMAVVKAGGYGHGAASVAAAALEAGATWLGVALLEEGIELRRAGIKAPILIFGHVAPAQVDMVILYDLRPAIWQLPMAQAFGQWARLLGRTLPVHVKVDTGMGRIGLAPPEVVPFVEALAAIPGIQVEGIFTHLAAADEPGNPYTERQLQAFDAALTALAANGALPKIRHAANSAGILLHPNAHYTMVRAGIALYGLPPAPGVDGGATLKPALTWKTVIGHIKRMPSNSTISYGCTYQTAPGERIATLPVGYADGLRRSLSNRGEVLVSGVRCPIVGRVCMDQTMIRLPDDLTAQVGDEVVLIGRQGDAEITATEMASLLGTINYEVVTSLSVRVPRRFFRHGKQGSDPM